MHRCLPIRWLLPSVIATSSLLAQAEATAGTPLIDDARQVASLPAPAERLRAPLEFGYLLMELTERAENSLSEKDYPRSVRYFEAVVAAAPERSIGHAKLCEALMGAGDVARAIDACHEALGREGVRASDSLQFLRALLAQPHSPTPSQVADFDNVLGHLAHEDALTPAAHALNCELALRLKDSQRLDLCTGELERLVPTDASTAAFAWAKALSARNREQALAAIDRAETLGLAPARLEQMRRATEEAAPSDRSWLLVLAMAFVTALLAVAFVRSRRGHSVLTHRTVAAAES